MVTTLETTFAVTFANLVMGRGATREVGDHVADLGLRRVLLLTDPRLRELAPVGIALHSLRRCGVEVDIFDAVEVEPTDTSFEAAGAVAAAGRYDGFVAVGGGSVIDTAKAANLLATHPAPLLDYVNKPIGAGKPPPGPLRPLVAVPTTAGTGSETTGVRSWTGGRSMPRPASPIASCDRRSASSIRTTPGPCRRWSPRRRGSMSSSRAGVVHRDPVRQPARARAAQPATVVPGRQPVQRRLGAPGDRDVVVQALPRSSTTRRTTRLGS